MAYDLTDLVKVQELKTTTERVKSFIEGIDAANIKGAKVDNNTLKLYTTTDTTTTDSTLIAASIDLPAEQFLDATTTKFEQEFTFSTITYPGATNPDLDGKAVLVLGVKTRSNDGVTAGVAYSFVDISALVDVVEASDTSIIALNNKIKVKLDNDTTNAIELGEGGLIVHTATAVEIGEMLDEIFPTVSGGTGN